MQTLKTFLDTLLGVYSPITDSSGVIPVGFAGVDFPYIVRAVVFIIVLWSLLRILGGMICRK